MPACSLLWWLRSWLPALALPLLLAGSTLGQQPTGPVPPLTPAQQAKLQERDGLEREANKLIGAGKVADAMADAEKLLVLEREVFGQVRLGELSWLKTSRS